MCTRPTGSGCFAAITSSSTPALLGSVSAVYDRAALISWKPAARASYVEHLTSLTSPGTQTLLIAVEFPQEQMSGPPFPVTRDTIENLYARPLFNRGAGPA